MLKNANKLEKLTMHKDSSSLIPGKKYLQKISMFPRGSRVKLHFHEIILFLKFVKRLSALVGNSELGVKII